MKAKSQALRRGDIFQSYAMLLPSIIGFGMFVVYPLLWVVRYCLYRYTGVGTAIFVGLENFIRLFTNSPRYWQSVGNTFVFAIGKLMVELTLAMVCAVLLSGSLRGRSFFRTIYFLPSMLSVAVMGIIFYYLFGSFNGVVNEAIRAVGGPRISWFTDPVLAMVVLMITSIWQNFGLNMLFFMTGLQSIPVELYEAGALDGVNGWQQFFQITLPMLGPVMQMVVMNALLGSLKLTDLVLVMTDGRPDGATEVMMSYIYKQFFNTGIGRANNYGYAAVLVIMTALILGVVTALYLRATRKSSEI
jgi:raffinose/stachyose/melibiose transport system permease protein